jgi:hypothetical protein
LKALFGKEKLKRSRQMEEARRGDCAEFLNKSQ